MAMLQFYKKVVSQTSILQIPSWKLVYFWSGFIDPTLIHPSRSVIGVKEKNIKTTFFWNGQVEGLDWYQWKSSQCPQNTQKGFQKAWRSTTWLNLEKQQQRKQAKKKRMNTFSFSASKCNDKNSRRKASNLKVSLFSLWG